MPVAERALAGARPFRAQLSTAQQWLPCFSGTTPSNEPFECDTRPADLARISEAAGEIAKRSPVRASERWSIALLDLAAGADDARLKAIVEDLGEIADSLGSPAAYNDLAVALLASYERHHDALSLLSALNAIERAFLKDSTSRYIVFNRAFILAKAHLYEESGFAVGHSLRDERDTLVRADLALLTRELRSRSNSARFDTAALDLSRAAREDPQGARDRMLDYYIKVWSGADDAHVQLQHAMRVATSKIAHALADRSGDSSTLHIARDLDRRGLESAIQSNLDGVTTFRRGDYAAAAAPLERADRSFRRAGALALADWNALTLAASYMLSSRYDLSDPLYREIRRAAIQRRDLALEARCSWGLALSSARRDRASYAIEEYANAARIFSEIGEWGNRASMLSQASDVAFSLGQDAQALNDKVEAMSALERRRDPALRAGPVLGFADQVAELRLPYAHIAILRDAARSAATSERVPDEAEALLRLVRAQVAAGNSEEARRTLPLAEKAQSRTTDSVMAGRLNAELALVEASMLEQSSPKDAIGKLVQASNYYRDHSVYFTRIPILIREAELRLRTGDTTAAVRTFDQAVSFIESKVGDVSTQSQTREVAASRSRVFNRLAQLKLAGHDTMAAFVFAERARGNRSPQISTASLTGTHLAYSVLPDVLLRWTVRAGRLQAKQIAVTEDSLTNIVRQFELLTRTDAASKSWASISATLFDLLVSDLAISSDSSHGIFIAAEGPLQSVPFAALRPANGRYLVEQTPITYENAVQPKSGVLRTDGKALVFGDPDFDVKQFPGLQRLDGAGREAHLIASDYRQATLYQGEAATKEVLLRALPSVRIFHFAGHARLVERLPERSHLVLASTEYRRSSTTGSDSVVTNISNNSLSAAEIRSLRLQNLQLVVLSSCGTAQTSHNGRVVAENSVAQAFLDAGAQGVISAKWEADDDATSKLMIEFHRQLRTAANPAVALQRAQVEAIRLRASSDAHLWSGFRYEVQ